MSFNSVQFLLFFILIVLLFYIIKREWRVYLLLAASYYFYMQWNIKYSLLILTVTVFSYGIALGIKHFPERKRLFLGVGCIACLGILFVFKYFNFVVYNINELLRHANAISALNVLLPVGISFYTFQAIGYMIDVHRGTVEAEKNLWKYALFVCFFPQLVAGPIERSENLLKEIDKIRTQRFECEKFYQGVLLMAWGMFEKVIISDRTAIIVNQIYENYTEYGLIPIALATVFFGIQIYCDFDGYTNIARGCARVLGIELMCNFRQPYFSQSIHEFWDRWHISLSSWFQDYLYIPLGGNRKGEVRKYINVMIVFLLSGLWHGADWTFIIWGGIHGICNIFESVCKIGKKKASSFSMKIRRIIITFGVVDFAWLFFRADSIQHMKGLLYQMTHMLGDFSDVVMCMEQNQLYILVIGLVILLVGDILRFQGKSLYTLLSKQEIWFRYLIYIGIVVLLIYLPMYSVTYEPNQFIYFQF